MHIEKIHELFDLRRKTQPDQVFLHTLSGPLTFAQLGCWIDQLEDELRAQGVRPGDRVLMVVENCPEHVALIFACSRVGAWACSINARVPAEEVDAFASQADARLTYFTSGISDTAAAHGARFSASDSVIAGLSRSPVRESAQTEPAPLGEQVAAMIFTSGTTGAPKGVPVTHAGLLQFGRSVVACRAMTSQDRSHAYLPMTHIFGLGSLLIGSLTAGSSLLMRRRFDPADVFDALANHGVSVLHGPPALFARLLAWLDEQGIAQPVCPSLRYVYAGAAPLDLTLKKTIEARLGLPVYHGYGMSEYAGGATMVRMGRSRDDTSTGELLEGAEIRLVDAQGQDVAQGERGEIWLRGVGLMPGYFRDAKATAEVMRPGGWFASGDIGMWDAEQSLFVVGRLKEMIIRSGFNVYPGEIEAAILRAPGIRNAAVVGRREADGNEEILAFIEPEADAVLDKPALERHLRSQLAAYKCPTCIVEVAALPMTSSGKVLKRALLERPEVAQA